MAGDAYRGTEEAARARLAELQVEREKRLADFAELRIPVPPRKKKIDDSLAAPDPVRVVASVLALLVIVFALITEHALEAGVFAGVLVAINMKYGPYYTRLVRGAALEIPKIPHVSEFKDPEPVDPPKIKLRQRVLNVEEEKARQLEIEKCRRAFDEVEQEIAEAEELLERAAEEAEKENRG